GCEQSPKRPPVSSVETVRSGGSPRAGPSSPAAAGLPPPCLLAELQRPADLGRPVLVEGDAVPGPVTGPHPVVANNFRSTQNLEASGRGSLHAAGHCVQAGALLLLRYRDAQRATAEGGASRSEQDQAHASGRRANESPVTFRYPLCHLLASARSDRPVI